VSKRTDSPGLGSLGAGAVTGVALAVQTGLAAVVGVIVARELGRDAETDGFFAAYAVYVVVILAANAIRVVVLPPLARAREERELGAEVAAYAVTVGALALPLLLAVTVAADPLAWLLTGAGPDEARTTASDALPWMLLAGVFQLYAGLAASALAALDDYVVAALGYVLGSAAGLALVLARIDSDGVEAVSWGMALNGAVALAVPTVALGLRARAERMPRTAAQPAAIVFRSRLSELGTGIAVALALQAIYLVCVPLAGREGEGALTSFSYAYLIMSAVVAASASSLGLVTSVPLTRAGLDSARAARHIVSSSWLAIVAVGATVGIFAVAGGDIVEALLGSAYGAEVGSELGRVVVALAPWAVVSVGSSVTFPLVFVAGRTRRLPLLALAALAVHVPLAFAGQAAFGLDGLALALALTTGFLLGGALALLDVLALVARGLAVAAVVVAALAALAYAPAGFALDGSAVAAAAVGTLLYAAVVALVRPRPLVEAWRYLRTLS
jgi:hypothetical protein